MGRPESGGRQPNDWTYEENTRVIGKLGYVPPEARQDAPDKFDVDRMSPQDRAKFKTRRRARKTSPLVRIAVIAGLVLVVGAVGVGIWSLTGGEEAEPESELAYQALSAPCDPLDVGSLEDLSTEVTPMIEDISEIGSKTEQRCAIQVGNEPGSGADVEVTTTVFGLNAGARNEYEHVQGKLADTDGYAEISGVGEATFVVSRPWSDDTGTADYSLHAWDGNAYLYARVVLYTEISEDEIADRAATIAGTYFDNWRS